MRRWLPRRWRGILAPTVGRLVLAPAVDDVERGPGLRRLQAGARA
jgi:hypothetical protein